MYVHTYQLWVQQFVSTYGYEYMYLNLYSDFELLCSRGARLIPLQIRCFTDSRCVLLSEHTSNFNSVSLVPVRTLFAPLVVYVYVIYIRNSNSTYITHFMYNYVPTYLLIPVLQLFTTTGIGFHTKLICKYNKF